MRLRWLFPVFGLSTLVAAACTSSTDTDTPGEAGAPAEATGGASSGAGGTDAAEAGSAGTTAGGACAEDGSGTLVIEVTGLPTAVTPEVSIEGADSLLVEDAESTLEDIAAGAYTVTAERVFDADPIVRTVFDATVTGPSFCLADGGSHTIKVTYTAVPSSNKLWLPTAQDSELAGFKSSAIAHTATMAPTVSVHGPGSGSVTFDKDGNLWAFGPTVADPHVVRFPAASLGASGTKVPDITLTLPEVTAVPAMRGMAFDLDGNLWLSTGGDEAVPNQVLRLAAADITTSGDDKVADVTLTALTDNEGLAFDADGNLWVAGGPDLVRFDAARLGEPDGDDPDLTLTLKDALAGIQANFLAFDKAGNLWGTDFAANAVFEVASADLAGTGAREQLVHRSITIGVTALLSQPAFDEGNGLWLGLDEGRIGRLSPTQLGVDAPSGSPATPALVITSSGIGAELPVAFYPAPVGLPLFHSIPEE